MRRLLRFVLVLGVSVLVGGCFGGGSVSPPIPPLPSESKSLLKISVQWDAFGQPAPAGVRQVDPNSITHVGARLEYPNESAVFMQSVERQVAEDIGVITMEVPAAQAANLYVAAVKYSSEWWGSRAIYYGVVRNLALPGGTIVEIRMSDIEWVEASWHVSADDEPIWNGNRVYEAPASQAALDRPAIYVRDPFQVGERPTVYHNLLIKINGSSSWGENPDGWRLFLIRAENPRVGEDNEAKYEFNPYLPGDKFNLPQALYWIEPIDNVYWVHWKE